jgi:uncharacterized protein YjbI with pentapeptide repeats
MIYKIRTFDILGRATAHEVDIGDRRMGIMGSFDAPWMDFRDLDLTNANLRGADLSGANFEGAILLGADFTEACLHKANLKNVDARYCNFTKTDLREANLENAQMYPAETIGAKFYGAKFLPGSDVAEYADWSGREVQANENCTHVGRIQ